VAISTRRATTRGAVSVVSQKPTLDSTSQSLKRRFARCTVRPTFDLKFNDFRRVEYTSKAHGIIQPTPSRCALSQATTRDFYGRTFAFPQGCGKQQSGAYRLFTGPTSKGR
jgi:hypothetical protein